MTLLVALLAAAACSDDRAAGADDPKGELAAVPAPAEARRLLLDPADPAWTAEAPDSFDVLFETTRGTFGVRVRRAWAPLGADRFFNLVRHGFYDDSRFYRIVEGFIAQFGLPGDPEVTAQWLDRTLSDDPVVASNLRGRLAYAMTGPDTRATQVYINLVDNVRLDSTGFAPFGEVVVGIETIDALFAGYGENAGGGMRAGRQDRIIMEGNVHLDRDFPDLDRIRRARIR